MPHIENPKAWPAGERYASFPIETPCKCADSIGFGTKFAYIRIIGAPMASQPQ
jgi:hypothetical protein